MLLGAKMAGLQPSSFDFRPMMFLVGGSAVGLFSSLIANLIIVPRFKVEDFPAYAIGFGIILPIALCAVLGFGIQFPSLIENQNRYDLQAQKLLKEKIIETPEVVLSEKWYEDWKEKREAYKWSLLDEDVPYTENQLHELIQLRAPHSHTIFRRKNLSPEFLEFYFNKIYSQRNPDQWGALREIVQHPNLPLALIEQLAEDTDYSERAADFAKRVLKKRGSD